MCHWAHEQPVNSEKTVTQVMVCSGKTSLKLSPAVTLKADNVLTELVPLAQGETLLVACCSAVSCV